MLAVAAGQASGFTYPLWSMVYNALSFGIAGMGSATIFFWLMIGNVAKPFKPKASRDKSAETFLVGVGLKAVDTP